MSEIQINQKICSIGATKTELKQKAKQFNSVENWKTVTNVTTLELVELLKKGYAVRSGIKKNGNSTEDIESAGWLFLDFDHSTLERTKQSPIYRFASLYYYTPSYEAGVNEKHRLVFRLERNVSSNEYKLLYEYILDTFFSDIKVDRLTNAGWLFFGPTKPEHVIMIDEKVTLPVDNFLSVITPASKKTTEVVKDKAALSEDTIKPRRLALEHICKKIWIDICNSTDIDRLYCLHKHNFQRQPDGQNLAKWHGHRPEDTEKEVGSGFLVIWNDEMLPPTWENQATGEKGNFIEYWHKYKNEKLAPSKKWDSLEDDYLRNYKVTKLVINDICKSFNVEKFDFSMYAKLAKEQKKRKKSNDKEYFRSLISKYLDKYVILIKGDGKDAYLVYDFASGLWRTKINAQQVWQYVVKKKIGEDFPGEFDLEDKFLVADSINYILNYVNYVGVENLIGIAKKSIEHCIPLANGHYDNKKEEFVEMFDPDLFNFHRFEYEYKKPKKSNVDIFLDYFSKQYPENVKQLLIDWMTVNIHGIAYKSRCMVNIYGPPETGKTVLGNLLVNILGDNVSVATTGSKFSKSDKFMGQRITQKTKVLFIDEFDNPTHEMWQRLKELTGSSEVRIEVEQKFLKSTSILVKLGITTVSQDNLTLTNWDDGGIRRRMIPIRHTLEMHKEELQEIDEFFSDREFCSDVFSYLLHQNPYDALKRIRNYAKSEYNKEEKLRLVSGNDKTLMFIHERIIFTDNPDDFVSNQELTTEFTKWLAVEMNCDMNDPYTKRLISNLTANIRVKSRIPENKIKWDLCPKQGEITYKKIKGQKVRGLKGIQLKEYEKDSEHELYDF